MFKIICKLQQLTPMIHFQAEESGACLRASEVKPKLDKFIRNWKKDIPVEWYIRGEKAQETGVFALDYKLRFAATGTPEIISNKKDKNGKMQYNICRSYFGDEKAVMYRQPVQMTVVCFIPELLECIKEYIEIFFVMHNFGTRQDKGFGSFVLSEIDGCTTGWEDKDYPDMVKDFVLYGLWYKYGKVEYAKKTVLEDVRMIYGLMKSGWNFTKIGMYPDDYFKGFIFRYFMEKNPEIMNDKKFIKTRLEFPNQKMHRSTIISEDVESADNKKACFYRALLGLPGYYEYKDKDRTGKVDVNSKEEIHRFHSPLLWTLAGRYMLAIPQLEGFEAILNKKFEFTGPINTALTATPDSFDFEDFLNNFCEDFNDKVTPKGGKIGLKDAKYNGLINIKNIRLKMFKDVK